MSLFKKIFFLLNFKIFLKKINNTEKSLLRNQRGEKLIYALFGDKAVKKQEADTSHALYEKKIVMTGFRDAELQKEIEDAGPREFEAAMEEAGAAAETGRALGASKFLDGRSQNSVRTRSQATCFRPGVHRHRDAARVRAQLAFRISISCI